MASTQWRVSEGGIFGLDYTAVFSIARALGVAADARFIEKIGAYEQEAVACINRREKPCTQEDREFCRAQYGQYLEWACGQCRQMKGKGHGAAGS